MLKHITIFLCSLLLTACAVGPDYVRPKTIVPIKFKEAHNKDWVVAKPQDDCDRGPWWLVFNDPQLNVLEAALNISNQNIANAIGQYEQALALVEEARASFFPTLTGSMSLTRQGTTSGSALTTPSGVILPGTATLAGATPSASSSSSSGSSVSTGHSLLFTATWEPDLWGSIRRTVEASIANAQASSAQLALARLSAQASLAQFYFQLRALDADQKLLDDTVKGYQESLRLTQNRYNAGVAALSDVVQAESLLEGAQAQAINNGISRAQFEHAIAVLIGQPPAAFSMKFSPLAAVPPQIPLELPSELLERRPDIAQAERLVAQANANIGVAIAAYFPNLTFTGSSSNQGLGFAHWFTMPPMSWSIGAQLAETIFDGGLRSATVAAMRATYQAQVASYRQTVLAAFQDVEDNLASLRILAAESIVQNEAAATAQRALELVLNQYKAGTVPYASVIVAQITAYNAEKNAADINGQRMTAAVGLIKALGGGWNTSALDAP